MLYCEFELHRQVEGYSDSLVESCPLGWWFSTHTNYQQAGTSRPKLLIGLFTDADIASDNSLKLASQWQAQLEKTTHTLDRLYKQTNSTNHICQNSPQIVAARSTVPEIITGHRWISIGDAAGTYDPLSGQGNYKAISNGLRAGQAIAELMSCDNRSKLQQFTDTQVNNYQRYLQTKREYYSIEQRWNSHAFWQRRVCRTDGAEDVNSVGVEQS